MRKNKLASAITGIVSTLVGAQLFAENQEASPIEEVVVTGIRGSLQRSMDLKREADGVLDAISAEDIGKFPDTNLAESLQRITGVSIDRSGGEGQLITVRGFGPQFNTVLVNGRQIATENDSRAFSFDTIASELVNGIEVYKTSSATMQSGGVGSTVNVKTARPFDINGFKVVGSVKAVSDQNSDDTTPQMSVMVSNTFADEKFGVLVSVSHQERNTRLNQAQMDGWLENVGIPTEELNNGQGVPEGTTVFSPRNYDHKVTFEERTRTNGSLVLQFQPSDEFILTSDLMYSDFDVVADATSYGHWFTAPNIENATTDTNGTVIDLYQEVGLATDMHAKAFDRLTETMSFGLNAEWQMSDQLAMNFDFHHSNSERDANNGRGNQLSLIGYANRVRFQVDENILPVMSSFDEANPDIYSGQQELSGVAYDPAVTPAGVSNHLDTANSRAHVMLRRGWAVEDEVNQFKFDGAWDDGNETGLTGAKFGAMYTMQTKTLERWDNEGVGIHCTYCGYPDAPEIPAASQYVFDAGSDFLSDVSGSGRMPTQWLAHDGEEHFAFLESYYASVNPDTISFDAVRRDNSFEVEENTFAAYVELDFAGEIAGMALTAVSGVRIETTSTTVNGTEAPITGLTILDETEMLAQFGEASPVSESKHYDAILPNMSAKLEITDDMLLRIAASKSLTRPSLGSMAPVTVINTTRQGGDLTSSSGNAELEPFESDNFDLSWEWSYDDASYVSASYFKKEVSNFIVNAKEDKTFEVNGLQLTDPSTGTDTGAADAADSVAVFTNTLPSNSETAGVDGFEFAIQHAFGDSGFGLLFNATMVNSDAELEPSDVDQVFALVGLSDSYNLVGYYDNGPFEFRLAYNQRDQFVQSLTQVQGNGPVIVEEYGQWDMRGSYDFSENISAFLEGINLTNEYVHKRGRYSNHLLFIEDSGTRWSLGLRASF